MASNPMLNAVLRFQNQQTTAPQQPIGPPSPETLPTPEEPEPQPGPGAISGGPPGAIPEWEFRVLLEDPSGQER